MSFFTRRRLPVVQVQKKYNASQPRGKDGRWIAVRYGSGEYGLAQIYRKGKALMNRAHPKGVTYTKWRDAFNAAQHLNRGNESLPPKKKAKVVDLHV